MRRITFVVATLAGLAGETARADFIPQIDGLPNSYIPGVPFTFEVRAPGLPDFSGFTVQLFFEASVTDPDLSATAAPDPTQYPFPSIAGFTPTGTPPDPCGSTFTLMFSDSGPSVFTTPGVNDLLAIVTVTPGADLTGEIDISFGNETVLLYNKEGRRDSLPGTIAVEQGAAGSVPPVPTPAGIVLAGIGGLVLALRSRLKRPGKSTV